MPRTRLPVKNGPTTSAEERARAFASVAKRFSRFRPAPDVLTRVVGQPTIFPAVDNLTGIGGWPVGRMTLVHGPSNHGKTYFAHGLGLSWLQAGGFYAFIDAEHATPEQWLSAIMGDFAKHPAFVGMRPTNFEEVIDGVRDLLDTIGEAKVKGTIEPDTRSLIVIDSIRKLVPDKLMSKILAKGAAEVGADGAGGRGAQMRAAFTAQWLDELIPHIAHADATVLIVAREYEPAATEDAAMKYRTRDASDAQTYKVGGGKALLLDAAIWARITKTLVFDGAGKDAPVIGERHSVELTKTKVSARTDRKMVGAFHTSNGAITPAGFDRARDVIELALEQGVLAASGAWLSWDGQRWQGKNALAKALHAQPELLDTLEGEVRQTDDDAAETSRLVPDDEPGEQESSDNEE